MVRRYPVIYQSGLPKELPSGDSVLGNAFRGTTAPVSPAAGDLWFDTNTGVDVLKVYNGTGWDASSGSIATVVSGSAPGSPVNGQLWYDTANGYLKIYISSSSSWVACEREVFQATSAPSSGVQEGDIWYNSSSGEFSMYIGSSWASMGGGAGATPPISENNQVISASYSLTADKNGVSVGPITISSGQTLTVPANSRYVVL